jgi:hypothetical protein
LTAIAPIFARKAQDFYSENLKLATSFLLYVRKYAVYVQTNAGNTRPNIASFVQMHAMSVLKHVTNIISR